MLRIDRLQAFVVEPDSASSVPTLKFSSTMSDRAAMARTTSWPSGLSSSSVIERLPRLTER